jgi:hypothetical protein
VNLPALLLTAFIGLLPSENAVADVILEYYGAPLTPSIADRTPIQPTIAVRATIRLPDWALAPNGAFGDNSYLPGGQRTVKSAVITAGTRVFDYKNPKHRVELSFTTNARGEIVEWQMAAGFDGASTLNTIGGFGNTIVVLGPGRTTVGEGASIRGADGCSALDLVAGKGVACAIGKWTVLRNAEPQNQFGDVRLYIGAKDVTGTKVTVVVGEQIEIAAMANGVPATQGRWAVRGNAVGGYSQASDSATMYPIRTDNPSKVVLHFFSAGGNYSVSLSGPTGSLVPAPTVVFDAIAPVEPTLHVQSTGVVTITAANNSISGLDFGLGPLRLSGTYPMAMYFGQTNSANPLGLAQIRAGIPGIQFAGWITAAPQQTAGTLRWVQVVERNEVAFEYAAGSPQSYAECKTGADTFPFPSLPSSAVTISGPAGAIFATDTPGVTLPDAYLGYPDRREVSRVSAASTFSMYLMWQSSAPRAIAIALARVQWRWAAAVRATSSPTQSEHVVWNLDGTETHSIEKVQLAVPPPTWSTSIHKLDSRVACK